jgi:hypothetical protein
MKGIEFKNDIKIIEALLQLLPMVLMIKSIYKRDS